MKIKRVAAAVAALAATVMAAGCAPQTDEEEIGGGVDVTENLPETEGPTETENTPDYEIQPEEPSEPAVKTVTYLCVTSNGVNVRTGAGTGYSALGAAEKGAQLAYLGTENGWYKTQYRNKIAYISAKYCVFTEMEASGNEKIEAVIAAGCTLLGTPYVYGAVRLHDGTGRFLSGFTTGAFDCSSLMQYIFYKGAGAILDVTTRTQVKQGVTVPKSKLQRGDLMFFTNSSRYNKTGIERIGHVAIYLGGNLILHTASDYARIEEITATRWSYFIQAQRIL